jgi:uncharacterized protein YqhQ
VKHFNYGGQAVIEGVMIRGRNKVAIAVRRPDGEVEIIDQPLATVYKGRLREIPFVRGIIVLIETLILGTKALLRSAEIASADEDEEQISAKVLWGTVIISIVFAVAIFFVSPLLVTHYLIYPYIASATVANILEGVLRIGIFILYLLIIGQLPDIKRVFAYHGAEHKTVNAYESGIPLELVHVKNYPTAHTRCGTSFLLIVLTIAIIVFVLLGRLPLWLAIISRIVLLPAIAAIGYEFVRFGSAHANNRFLRLLLVPGLGLQSLTTREPDDGQVEVAIMALKRCVEADEGEQLNYKEA